MTAPKVVCFSPWRTLTDTTLGRGSCKFHESYAGKLIALFGFFFLRKASMPFFSPVREADAYEGRDDLRRERSESIQISRGPGRSPEVCRFSLTLSARFDAFRRCTHRRVDEGERVRRRSRLITGELQPLRVTAQLSSTGRDPQPYIRGLRRDLTSTHPTLDEPRRHPLFPTTVTSLYALDSPHASHALLQSVVYWA